MLILLMNFLVGYDCRMVFSIVRLREVSEKQEFVGIVNSNFMTKGWG